MPKGSKFDEGKVRFDLVPWKVWPGTSTLLRTAMCGDYAEVIERASLALEAFNIDPHLEVALILDYGANKHGKYNWKKVKPHRYVAALARHCKHMEHGEIIDQESGYYHLGHIICNCLFLRYLETYGS